MLACIVRFIDRFACMALQANLQARVQQWASVAISIGLRAAFRELGFRVLNLGSRFRVSGLGV